jgi:hypothetical protein
MLAIAVQGANTNQLNSTMLSLTLLLARCVLSRVKATKHFYSCCLHMDALGAHIKQHTGVLVHTKHQRCAFDVLLHCWRP